MRHILKAVAVSLALAACGQAAPTASAPAASGPSAPFPDVLQTPFRAAAAMLGPEGASLSVIVTRDGTKSRVEVQSPQGEVLRVTDTSTGETFLWRRQLGRNVLLTPPKAGDPPPDYVFPDFWWEGADVAASMRRVGACEHLNQRGAEWAREGESGAQNVCVTEDGVVLWAANSGATVWRLTSLQRGPQDASEFALPAGARPESAPPVEAERDLDAAYVPPPQNSTHTDTPAPQNQ
jgi:hypothetical protein